METKTGDFPKASKPGNITTQEARARLVNCGYRVHVGFALVTVQHSGGNHAGDLTIDASGEVDEVDEAAVMRIVHRS